MRLSAELRGNFGLLRKHESRVRKSRGGSGIVGEPRHFWDTITDACTSSVLRMGPCEFLPSMYMQGATGMKKNDIGSIKKFRALALDLPTST